MDDNIPQFLRSWWTLLAGALYAVGAAFTGFVAAVKLVLDSEIFSDKPKAEIHLTTSEAELNEAEAHFKITQAESLSWHDQLAGIEIVDKLMRNGLALEGLLAKKNDIIAAHEDREFGYKKEINELKAELKAYEEQKLEVIGEKRLAQSRSGE